MTGATVLVTRPRGQEGPLVDALEAAGFRCRHVPLLEIQPFDSPDDQQRQLLLNLCDPFSPDDPLVVNEIVTAVVLDLSKEVVEPVQEIWITFVD